MKKLSMWAIFLLTSLTANAGWFCEEAASERNGNNLMVCGIGSGETEALARKDALKTAFEELDTICEKSIDCKTMETLIEPLRSDCRKEKKGYKCFRALTATITKTKRKTPFKKEESLKPDQNKLDIKITINPNDFIKIDDKDNKAKLKCPSDLTALNASMHDISTKELQDQMAQEASKVPFDSLCATVHYKIMGVLNRYKIKNEHYSKFLVKTMDEIVETCDDDRVYWILDYLKAVGPLEETEWSAGLNALSRCQKHSLYRLMPRLFSDQIISKKQQEIEKKHAEEMVELVLKNQIGKPLPIDFDYAMELFLRSLSSYKTKDNPWLVIYVFNKYQNKLKRTSPDKIHKGLRKLYTDATDEKAKAFLNLAMAQNVEKSQPDYYFSKSIVDHLQSFKKAIKKLDDEEDEDIKIIKMLEEHQKDFISKSGKNLIANINITKNDFEKKSRGHLCLEYNLPCQEILPDKSKISKLLESKKTSKRLDALELLNKMPDLAKKMESQIIKNLNDAIKGKIENANSLLKSSAITLSIIPTKDKKALKNISDMILLGRLSSQYIREGLGKNLEPLWIERLNDQNTRYQHQILRELGEYETLEKSSCQALDKMKNPKNPYFVTNAIEKALELCSN